MHTLFKRKKRSLFLVLGFILALACQQNSGNLEGSSKKTFIISGSIEIQQGLKKKVDPLSVLFVMARAPGGGMVAVKKMMPPFVFPLEFTLDENDLMISGTEIPKNLIVTARLDKDGNANPTQKGDILGKTPQKEIKRGQSEVKILLDQWVD